MSSKILPAASQITSFRESLGSDVDVKEMRNGNSPSNLRVCEKSSQNLKSTANVMTVWLYQWSFIF